MLIGGEVGSRNLRCLRKTRLRGVENEDWMNCEPQKFRDDKNW